MDHPQWSMYYKFSLPFILFDHELCSEVLKVTTFFHYFTFKGMWNFCLINSFLFKKISYLFKNCRQKTRQIYRIKNPTLWGFLLQTRGKYVENFFMSSPKAQDLYTFWCEFWNWYYHWQIIGTIYYCATR